MYIRYIYLYMYMMHIYYVICDIYAYIYMLLQYDVVLFKGLLLLRAVLYIVGMYSL